MNGVHGKGAYGVSDLLGVVDGDHEDGLDAAVGFRSFGGRGCWSARVILACALDRLVNRLIVIAIVFRGYWSWCDRSGRRGWEFRLSPAKGIVVVL